MVMFQASVIVGLAAVQQVSAHGYVTMPISRQEMSHSHYVDGMPSKRRYDPQSSEGSGACGAGSDYTESTRSWDAWYKAAGVSVPHLPAGKDFTFSGTLTADHGGQAWLQVACADSIAEGLPWTNLERAHGDRNHNFLPSSPRIYAWRLGQGGMMNSRWTMPSSFACPGGRGVGRWVWKTGNSCTDANNLGNHKTETFSRDEFCAIPGGWCPDLCRAGGGSPGAGGAVETFLSCFDFTTGTGPTPPVPIPVPTPPAPTPVPTPPAPTPNPTVPACCWVAWGDETTCQNYPGPVGKGLCNIDWGQECITAADCEHASITV